MSMKKASIKATCLGVFIVISISITFTGCGSNAKLTSAQNELSSVAAKNEKLRAEYNDLESAYNVLYAEYQEFKEKMKPYEELSLAEAEAAKLRAEQEKAAIEQQQAESKAIEASVAAQAAADAEAARIAEAAKGYETGITYEQLARTPDDYKGDKIKFTGKVIQVIEGSEEIKIRLAVNSNYDTIILCGYAP